VAMSEPGVVKRSLEAILNFKYLVLISIAAFFVILILAGLMVLINARLMKEQIDKDFNQQQLILARQVAKRIDGNLSELNLEMDGLCRLDLQHLNSKDLDLILRSFAERTREHGLLGSGIIGPEGELIRSFDINENEFPPQAQRKALYESYSEGGANIGKLYIESHDAGQSKITAYLCHPLSGSQDMLCAKISISQLVKDVAGDITSGKTGYAWVINEEGMFLYHPDRDFIGRNAFKARQERQPYISFSEINNIMKARMLKGEEGTGLYESGWHRGIQGRMTKLIAFTPVQSTLLGPGHEWSVAVAAPISEVAETVHNMYLRHLAVEVAMLAGMFLFGLLVAVYQQRISRTLKARISQQEEYISSILRSSVDAIIFIDNDNKVKVWNRGAELIFGFSEEEMLGQTFHKLIPPELDADEELIRIKQEVRTKGYIRDYRGQRMTRDGRRITIDLSRTLVTSDNGEIIGSVAVIRDVTEKIAMEQHIYNTEKLASIGILAAGIAHEINNPLAAILGFTDLIKEKLAPGSPEYEDLMIVEENANHAKSIVENMLGFARTSEGLENQVDVIQAMESVINIVKNTLLVKKVDLCLELPETLPHIKGDPREFQQVLFNLVNNSISAMLDKGGKLTISAVAVDNAVTVNVRDTGVGIPNRIKTRVYDPFFTTKSAGEGTGLGLSLCYGIVQKCGGQIGFTSVSAEDNPDLPSGTTFTVRFPVIDCEKTGDES
jgi:two-component system NtrC family sensor kinase